MKLNNTSIKNIMEYKIQTFLPYSNFIESAKCLDYKRLGKQRCEAKQILQCLIGEGSLRWGSHPCVKMWKGYEYALALYGITICDEWISRGYKDNTKIFFENYISKTNTPIQYPPFLTDINFITSHQSNLVRKDPVHYRKFFPNVPDNLPYLWIY